MGLNGEDDARKFADILADALEDEALRMRGDEFRSGAVGIEYINGFEGAADFIRKYVRGVGPVTNPPA